MPSNHENNNDSPAHLHHQLDARAKDAVHRFADRVNVDFQGNLSGLFVFGPVVTPIFDPREHSIHFLIVTERREVAPLLQLGKYGNHAAKDRIAPPLLMTQAALRSSYDVFPLEWLDILQFHIRLSGAFELEPDRITRDKVRIQCERDLRAVDIRLQRGIIACRGETKRLNRLEEESSDLLIRVLRGIVWLTGQNLALLPLELCSKCEEILGTQLRGTRETIRPGGVHDLSTMEQLLTELGQLSDWIDRH